jgi:alkylation response protein AidB-like acyl-CoA dehydrogenase
MGNFYHDNDDLRFYVERGLDWEAIVSLTENDFTDEGGFGSTAEAVAFYGDILEAMGDFAANEVAPRAAIIDHTPLELVNGEVRVPKQLDEVFDGLRQLGVHGMCLPRELGGLNIPLAVYMMNAEMLARADVGIMTHHSFHGGIAMAMLVYSIHEGTTEFTADGRIKSTRFEKEIRDIAEGRAWGCMDITEPDAGSDMAALRTRAVKGDDGVWRLTGQKIFITSGHGKYHFVVARTHDRNPDGSEAGLDGLSFFLVDAWDETAEGRHRHATIGRIEEKLGHHSSATCQIDFENTPAHLVGEVGAGFRQMLVLMNNARIGVSFEGIGIAECAYRLASEYAAQRHSMGKAIAHHEMIADYLEDMRVDIAALRALTMHGAFHEEMSQKLQLASKFRWSGDRAAKVKAALAHHRAEARRTTPLSKYLTSEKAVAIARQAIQIHGGVGYTKDYGVEKLLRDAMVLPIYEGTSQIQSLMVMKDTLSGVMRDPQGFVRGLAQAKWRSLSAKDPLERRVAALRHTQLRAAQTMMQRTAVDKFRTLGSVPVAEWAGTIRSNWDPKRDFSFAMRHAERLTLIEAHATTAEILLAQAKEHEDRRELAEAWVQRAEPQVEFWMKAIG